MTVVISGREFQAAMKLGQAVDIITQHPVALQLRTLQTMAEISIEKNSTIIFPAQFMTTVQESLVTVTKRFSIKMRCPSVKPQPWEPLVFAVTVHMYLLRQLGRRDRSIYS